MRLGGTFGDRVTDDHRTFQPVHLPPLPDQLILWQSEEGPQKHVQGPAGEASHGVSQRPLTVFPEATERFDNHLARACFEADVELEHPAGWNIADINRLALDAHAHIRGEDDPSITFHACRAVPLKELREQRVDDGV
ncbi:MAG: hypothetical protein HY898_29225 [Deltaproteobacteria bacterium]|nr:hypothetical protein [Deltaproteobacteria bacterium]